MTTKTMMVMVFFHTFIPLGSFFILVGLFVLYWVLKFKLLKLSTHYKDLDYGLYFDMLDLLEYFIPLLAIGQMYLAYQQVETISTLAIITLSVALVNLIVPSHVINQLLFNIKDNEV